MVAHVMNATVATTLTSQDQAIAILILVNVYSACLTLKEITAKYAKPDIMATQSIKHVLVGTPEYLVTIYVHFLLQNISDFYFLFYYKVYHNILYVFEN